MKLPGAVMEENVGWWAIPTQVVASKHDPSHRHADAQGERKGGVAQPWSWHSALPPPGLVGSGKGGASWQGSTQHSLDASFPFPGGAQLPFQAQRRGEEFPGLLGTPAPTGSSGGWDGSQLFSFMVGCGIVKIITVAAIW